MVVRVLEIQRSGEVASGPGQFAVDGSAAAVLVGHRDLVRKGRARHGAEALVLTVFCQQGPGQFGALAAAAKTGVVATTGIQALRQVDRRIFPTAGPPRRHGNRSAHRLGPETRRRRAAQHLDALDLLRAQGRQFAHRRDEAIDHHGNAAHPAHADDAVVLIQPDPALEHLQQTGRLLAGDVGGGDQGDIRFGNLASPSRPGQEQQQEHGSRNEHSARARHCGDPCIRIAVRGNAGRRCCSLPDSVPRCGLAQPRADASRSWHP